MFGKMLSFFRLKKKHKPTTNLSDCVSDAASSYSPFRRPERKGFLILPTSLDKVAAAAHRNGPTQLPGDDATEDDVRYFLYQILTHKEHGVVRQSPQWILETCMSWRGGGHQLRSLPLDGYQQLCPLYRGHAMIDWTVKCSKFSLQEMPPCGTRDRIAVAVQTAVATLKSNETGHRAPGWQDSHTSRRSAVSKSTDCLAAQNPALSMYSDFFVSPFAAAPTYPTQDQFYNFGNQSLPQINSVPFLSACQDPYPTQRGSFYIQPQNTLPSFEPLKRLFGSDYDPLPCPDEKRCIRSFSPSSLPPEPLPSPALSYARSDGMMSQTSSATQLSPSTRDSTSTARTSPPSSEKENSACSYRFETPCLLSQPAGYAISQSSTDEQYIATNTDPAIAHRTSVRIPSRYKMTSHPRSFDPQLHMAHLRHASYSTTAMPRFSSSTLACDSTYDCEHRRDSAMSPEMKPRPLHHEPSFQSSTQPTPSSSSVARKYSRPPQRRPAPPTLETSSPVVRSREIFARPSSGYALGTHTLDAADQLSYKSRSEPSLIMVDQGERLRRGKNDGVPLARVSNYGVSGYGGEPVLPHIQFPDPQTGAPRLTMIETIAQHQQLGKQHLKGQRRVSQSQKRLKTVYEAI